MAGSRGRKRRGSPKGRSPRPQPAPSSVPPQSDASTRGQQGIPGFGDVGEPGGVELLMEQTISTSSGPIPAPEAFAGYEQTLDGAADRILTMAEQQARAPPGAGEGRIARTAGRPDARHVQRTGRRPGRSWGSPPSWPPWANPLRLPQSRDSTSPPWLRSSCTGVSVRPASWTSTRSRCPLGPDAPGLQDAVEISGGRSG